MRFFANAPFPRLSRFGLVALLLVFAASLLAGPGSALGQSGPSVTGVAVTSAPASGDTYGLGETIRVTLTFSETVDVTGTPRLKIDMDPAHWGQKWVNYESGSGTTSLTFAHQVVEPNESTQGIAVLANTLELNGGTIRSTASTDAVLSHVGLGHDANHKVDWQANRPATGAPAITGTAQVGETLTADTSGITDDDGLANATFSYQWLAGDADISGATSSAYTLAAANEGKTVGVRVSFTDDEGNAESVTSAATAAVAPPPLTASFENVPAQHDGESLFSFELHFSDNFPGRLPYRKLRDEAFQVDNGRVIEAKRVAQGENRRWTITVRPASSGDVVVTLPAGSVSTEAGRALSNTTSATVPMENRSATGAATITGTAQVGETLTVDTSGISDDNGLVNATFNYQWLADGAGISGATGPSYTLVSADEGKSIAVQVSFTDDAGNAETLSSAATAAVAPPPPAKPGGLIVHTEAGSLDVAVDWDDVEGAADYLVRWRLHGPDQELNEGMRTASSDAAVTVEAYGDWVVRVEACNSAGCGTQSARHFVVEPPKGYRGELGEVLVELSLERPAQEAAGEDASGQASGTRSASGQSEDTPQTTSIVYIVGDGNQMDSHSPELRSALRDVRDENMPNTKVALVGLSYIGQR